MSETCEMWDRFFVGSKYEAKWRSLSGSPPRPFAMPENPFMRLPRRRTRNNVRWRGDILESLRQAYEGSEKVATIAADFSTSPGRISEVAKKNGWKLRRARPKRQKP